MGQKIELSVHFELQVAGVLVIGGQLQNQNLQLEQSSG